MGQLKLHKIYSRNRVLGGYESDLNAPTPFLLTLGENRTKRKKKQPTL